MFKCRKVTHNVETESKTYCCGGSGLGVGLGWWQNLFVRVGGKKILGMWVTKYFGGGLAKAFGVG